MDNATILVAVCTCVGASISALLASVISLIISHFDRKERRLTDKQLTKARSLCDQIATFYRLEQLYLEEIKKLRGKGEITGIMNEFRNKVYTSNENQSVRITLNDSSAVELKDVLFEM